MTGVVEYANVVAALSALVLALGAATARIATIPSAPGPALAVATESARQLGVPVAVARGAFRSAPYARNDLRALYAVAFVASRTPRNSCALEEAFGPPEIEDVAADLRRQPGLIDRLRKARIPVDVAAKAMQRGAVAGCA